MMRFYCTYVACLTVFLLILVAMFSNPVIPMSDTKGLAILETMALIGALLAIAWRPKN